MAKIKFILEDGTEMSKTETIHYLLKENKKLRERLDTLEAKSEFTFPFFGASTNDTIHLSAEEYQPQAAQQVPFSWVGGEDIISFNELDYKKVNDSWLD